MKYNISDQTKRKKVILDAMNNGGCSPNPSFIERKTGIKRVTVSRKINKMEKDGTIWGYVPIVDFKKIGKRRYIWLMKSKHNNLMKKHMDLYMGKIRNGTFVGSEHIVCSMRVFGRYDFIIIFDACNIEDANSFKCSVLNDFENVLEFEDMLEIVVSARQHNIINPNLQDIVEHIY